MSLVSKRDWHTTFLPQFKSCVDAGVFSLMCSYNSINGIPACANKYLLNDILRKKWGFKGWVFLEYLFDTTFSKAKLSFGKIGGEDGEGKEIRRMNINRPPIKLPIDFRSSCFKVT
jgi:hypothetical protein